MPGTRPRLSLHTPPATVPLASAPARHRPIRRACSDVRAWRRSVRTLAALASGSYRYAPPVPVMRGAQRVPLAWRRMAGM